MHIKRHLIGIVIALALCSGGGLIGTHAAHASSIHAVTTQARIHPSFTDPSCSYGDVLIQYNGTSSVICFNTTGIWRYDLYNASHEESGYFYLTMDWFDNHGGYHCQTFNQYADAHVAMYDIFRTIVSFSPGSC